MISKFKFKPVFRLKKAVFVLPKYKINGEKASK